MTREEIDRRHPALLRTLAHHPGIGFLLVASAEHGSVVLGRDGVEVPVAELADDGPLAVFGRGAARAVRRTDGFRTSRTSWSTPCTTRRPGPCTPSRSRSARTAGWAASSRTPSCSRRRTCRRRCGREELVGAEQVHRVLRRWLRESSGPQVPLGPVEISRSTSEVE
ncbi:hypothetical protein O1L60_32260 [Streptomyces diastatochromogenes]|nr:hypothetical protein [Streptomyces diastatochromogenes]